MSRVARRRYDWTFDAPGFIRGTRPDAVAWYAVPASPGWFLGEGWALTPELAGLARRDGAGLEHGPLVADLRRRAEPSTLVIGGRHLGTAADRLALLEVRLDAARLDAWTVAAGPFLRVISTPAGSIGGAGYARLTVHASAVGGAVLRLSGESSLKYVERAPTVVVRTGSAVLARRTPSADFDWHIHVPMPALAAGGGVVTITTDTIFRPAATDSADRRALGLRLFEVAIAR